MSTHANFPRVFSFGPPPAAASHPQKTRYPHRRRIRWCNVLTTIANYCLLLFTLFVLLVGLVDIGRAFIFSNRASKVADLAITFGTYVAVILLGLVMVLSRTLANKRAIVANPKGYLPTKSTDVPKKVHELIQNEYERACIITKVSQPSGRDQPGWGRPGTSCQDINFRAAILATIPTLPPLFPLAPLLALPSSASPVPNALRPLAELYEAHLVHARYGKAEPSERDWAECTKAVAVFVDVLSGLGAT